MRLCRSGEQMNNQVLVILAEQSLNSSLIKQQLSSLQLLTIYICNPDELLKLSREKVVNLVLVDYQYMEEMDKNSTLPNFEVLGLNLLLHNVPDTELREEFVNSTSLKGLLFQDVSVEHLTESVMHVLNGGLWLPRGWMEKMILCYRELGGCKNFSYSLLTNRERQILDLLSQGKSNKDMAEQLFVSESTIKTHVYKLYKKLDVHRRQDAITLLKNGIRNTK